MVFIVRINFVPFFLGVVVNLAPLNPAAAADSWTFGVTPQVLIAQYSGSSLRNSMLGYGLLAKVDYLEKGGITAGYNFTKVKGKSADQDIEETSLYASGRYVQYSDALAGKLGFRLDRYAIEDQSATRINVISGMRRNQTSTVIVNSFTDEVDALYGQLDYTNYGERFYADIGYAYSDYDYDAGEPPYQDNKVQQFTTTAGLALNDRYDWLQTRIYFIHLEHGENTGGVTQSAALEFKWLHWFKPGVPLNINSSFVKLMAGKRLFPVDPDVATTYSISDLQTSSVAAGVDWKIDEQSKIFLSIGYDQYENPVANDKYGSVYGFGSLSLNW